VEAGGPDKIVDEQLIYETKACPNPAKYRCVESGMHYCKPHKKHHGPEDSRHHFRRLEKLPTIENDDLEEETYEVDNAEL
jgi:hypothetical protein